jgi:Kef-type K+ transport system membrane component KefB
MSNAEITQLLGLLALMLVSAKALGIVARGFGVPALLGEMIAGVLLGQSVFGLVDADNKALQAIATFGFVIFLFQTGLELDLQQFLAALTPATPVAILGAMLPFLLGYAACTTLGLPTEVSLGVGAALTATSLGVTARLLSDLGRLKEPESQVILAGAILGNVLGLVMFGVVADYAGGEEVSVARVALTSSFTYGFLLLTLLPGCYVIPGVIRTVSRFEVPGMVTSVAVTVALGMAALAVWAGSVSAVGAFLAGLLVARAPQGAQVRRDVVHLEQVLVSLAFVFLGAEIDLRALSPLGESGGRLLMVGLTVTGASVVGKFLAGFGPFWLRANKRVIGMGMVPHGEIGLLFAQVGLANAVYDREIYSAVAFTVIVTTFLGVLGLQALYSRTPAAKEGMMADSATPWLPSDD